MAKQRRLGPARRDRKGGPTSTRRKSCPYCRDKVEQADCKDVSILRRFISDRGKIRSRRITGACRRHQSQVARAVKRARELALLPYVAEGREIIAVDAAIATVTATATGRLKRRCRRQFCSRTWTRR